MDQNSAISMESSPLALRYLFFMLFITRFDHWIYIEEAQHESYSFEPLSGYFIDAFLPLVGLIIPMLIKSVPPLQYISMEKSYLKRFCYFWELFAIISELKKLQEMSLS